MGVTLSTFLSYGAFFSWFVTGSVVLIKGVGITPVAFGWINFLGGGVTYALAALLNGKLVKKYGMPMMMRSGWIIMALAGLIMLICYFLIGLNCWAIAAPAILFYFGTAFIWPNAFATAFTPFGHIAGYAGALYGSMQISGAATLGGLMSWLPDTNQIGLALVTMVAPISALIIYESLVTKNSLNGTKL